MLNALCSAPSFKRRSLTKTLLIMKFTAILLFVACMQVSAKGYSQITLSEKNAPLQKIFKEIQSQTGYDFLFSYTLVQNAGKVTVNLKNASLKEAVEEVLKGKNLSYEILERTVVIKPKNEKPDGDAVPEPKLLIDVHGKVVNEKGEPVPGVTVTVTAGGGGAGAVTVRLNGSLTVEPGSGFKTVRAHVPAAAKVPFAFRVPADGDAVVGQAMPFI